LIRVALMIGHLGLRPGFVEDKVFPYSDRLLV